MTAIYASATVDTVRPSTPQAQGMFRVKVWGRDPHDYVRTYDIQAKSDNVAAQEGMRRFREEIEALLNEDT